MRRVGVVRGGLIGLLGVIVAGGMSLLPGILSAAPAGAAGPATTTLVIQPASPNPSPPGALQQWSATLSGGHTTDHVPMGSITLDLWKSADCSSNEHTFTNSLVDGNGTYLLGSNNPGTGTYYGDASFTDTDGYNSNSSTAACQPLLVVTATPQPTTLKLKVTPNTAPQGAVVKFTAILSGGLSFPNQPQGSISASVYTDDVCSDLAFTLGTTNNVEGNGSYVLGTEVPSVGTYYGSAYFADSDGVNASSSSGSCQQLLVVTDTPQPTTLTESATPSPAPLGASVQITATLSGGLNGVNAPQGNIAGGVYSNSNCTDLAFNTQTAEVDGNGTYTLDSDVTPAVGTYYGSAFFDDTDGLNASASSGSCQELFTVTNQKQETTLTLNVNPQISTHGTPVHFHATLSGGLASPNEPTGTITLKVYSNKGCTDVAFSLPAVSVDGNGTYDLGSDAPHAGTYYGFAKFHDTDGFNTDSTSGSCAAIFVVNHS